MATKKPFLLITKELTEKEIEQITKLVGVDCLARHMPRVLSASADLVDIEIAFNKRGELVAAIDGLNRPVRTIATFFLCCFPRFVIRFAA